MHFDLVIIDASAYLHRAFHALPPLSRQDGVPTGAVTGCMNMVFSQAREGVLTHASEVVAVFDAPGANFRHRIEPSYKRGRKRHDDLRVQFDIAKRGFHAFGIQTIAIEGVEADDTIAHLVEQYACDFPLRRIAILSSDKDLTQLVRGYEFDGTLRVAMIDVMGAKSGQVIDERAVIERWGVEPRKMASLLALTGDAADGVDGVPGIGPKTAAKMLRHYDDLGDLLQHIDDLTDQTQRLKLTLHHEAARAAYRLIRLPSPDCPQIHFEATTFASYAMSDTNVQAVLDFANEYEMRKFHDEVRDAWTVPQVAGVEA